MKIGNINSKVFKLSFKDALSTKQEKRYSQLMDKIRQIQGFDDGYRVVKVYTPAIPSNQAEDTGIGKPTSKEASRFYEIAKIYGGANAIKFMPMGQLTDKQSYEKGYPGAYLRSSMSIGEDIINLSDLTDEKYGFILPKDELNKFIAQHQNLNLPENKIDFQTTLGWKNQDQYPINGLLKIAFNNFKNNEYPNNQLMKLRVEFEAFKNQKEPIDYDDIYSRLAIFPYIKDPISAKTDLFVGFDSNPKIRQAKMPQYMALKEKYKDEIEFFKFKQFLSHKALTDAKNNINSLGMDLFGDCAIGFSWVEEQVFPDAFLRDKWGRSAQVGWGIHAINYHDIANNKNSAAAKLFKAKLIHYLDHFDGIRFDVGWSYLNPRFYFSEERKHTFNVGNRITDFIEQTAKEIKGENFDQRKLVYECDAAYDDFDLWRNKSRIKHMQGMAVLSTEDEKNDAANIGWGSLPFLKENIGLNNDDFILGTNNHDKEGVLRSSEDTIKSNANVGALLRVFNKRPEDGYPDAWKLFKDDNDRKAHVAKYTRGRFAEIDSAKHSYILYTDLLGRYDKIDYHGYSPQEDYKMRLERDYEANYHKALQGNTGYNAADVKSFRMEMDGTSSQYSYLFEAAKKYSAYLKHKGGIYTRQQADNSSRANLDIEKLTLEQINNLDIIG